MEDGYAEPPVFVDVRVIERSEETEFYRLSISNAADNRLSWRCVATWGRVGIVLREGHGRLEVAPVVHRVWVEHDQRNVPVEDVIVVELGTCVLARWISAAYA